MATPKGTAQTGQAVGRTEAHMGKRIKAAAAISGGCTHNHDAKYATCLGCKIRARAAARVAAGGLTTEQLRASKLAKAQALVQAAASKPASTRKGSGGKAVHPGTQVGEIAALREDFDKLTSLVTGLVQALSGSGATA